MLKRVTILLFLCFPMLISPASIFAQDQIDDDGYGTMQLSGDSFSTENEPSQNVELIAITIPGEKIDGPAQITLYNQYGEVINTIIVPSGGSYWLPGQTVYIPLSLLTLFPTF